jgi:alcohol dehydrogenase class IV
MPQVAGTRIVLDPMPPAHFGAGAVDAVAGAVRGTGCQAAVVVTDQGLAGTAMVASVAGVLAAGGIPVTVFSGALDGAGRVPPTRAAGPGPDGG